MTAPNESNATSVPVEMSHQPERALTQPMQFCIIVINTIRRNESSAREGIDTLSNSSSLSLSSLVEMSHQPERALTQNDLRHFFRKSNSCRNESSAREGIDTRR